MDTDNDSNNSKQQHTGAEAAPARMNSAQVRDTFQQSQASVSQFLQGNQRNFENLARSAAEPNLRVVKLERKVEELGGGLERNRDRIRNYRQ
jgi:hypothetical protein